MTSMYREFFQFPDFQNRFHLGIHVLGMGISIGCAALGCLYGSRSVLKLKPAEAMRPKPPRFGRKIFLERIGFFWRSLSSGWRMVLRNLFRSRVRTLACIFAAAMGASVLVNGFMMQKSMDYFIDFQFEKILRSDLDLTFKDERGKDALADVEKLPGVDYAEPKLDVACTFYNGPYSKKGTVTGLLSHARLTVPRDSEARPIRIPSHGLAISRKLAEILHVVPGESVFFEPVKGLKRKIQVPVVEISDSYLGTMVYADINFLSRLIGEEFAINGVK